MKVKVIITLVFVSTVALMMYLFTFFGNQPLNNTNTEPDWNNLEVNAELIRHGYLEYQIRCSKCHGRHHEGSFQAPSLADKEWIYNNSRESIYSIIANGSPTGKMKGWTSKIRTEDIQAITEYIMWLQENPEKK